MSASILELLAQHRLNPVKVSDNHGGEYGTPCPKCGGTDCFRFWPERDIWFCRRYGRGGDSKQFLEFFGDNQESEYGFSKPVGGK